MSLREVLSSYAGRRQLIRAPMLPPEPQMMKAREDVEKTLLQSIGTPNGLDLDDLLQRLRDALASGRWDLLTNRDWVNAAYCLQMGGSEPLLSNGRFMDIYFQRLLSLNRMTALKALIRFYLMNFDPQHPGIRRIASFLAEHVMNWQWLWRNRQVEISLFNPDEAPSQLAARAQEGPGAPTDYLEQMGFTGSMASARLVGHAFVRALDALQQFLETRPSSKAITKITSWAITEDRQFQYPHARARLAEALLLPWVARDPEPAMREQIERFLLENYRDLRLDHSRWNAVNEEARKVMRRWLTKASLEQFLEVVSLATAQDVTARRMWAARRHFWYAFYKRNYMQEAWVVFAREGAIRARSLAVKNDGATASFGSFRRGGDAQSTHAVLIMRIGTLVVADWSHNGKCHIWLESNVKAPKLYRVDYSRFELTNSSDFQQIHHSGWQTAVYQFINRHIGAPMTGSEYNL